MFMANKSEGQLVDLVMNEIVLWLVDILEHNVYALNFAYS